MSYRSDLEQASADVKRLRKNIFNVIKVTVIILAVALVAMGICLVANYSELGRSSQGNVRGDDGGGSPSSGSAKLRFSAEVTDGQIFLQVGQTIAYKNYIEATDKSQVNVDSNVDTSKAGTYTVTYTLGKSKLVLKVIVGKYSRQQVMDLVGRKAAELGITKEMTKEQQVRAIYAYVNAPEKSKENANIIFNDKSNSARNDWENDWLEEAYLTLTYKKGDCYSYYSVSKAFFEYFEIENLGIQRTAGYGNGTHFWSLVNIGTEKEPRWYYYDSTRLAGTFASTGKKQACLLTEEQLMSYKSSDGTTGFYQHDHSGYPAVSTTPLNG